MFPNYSAFWTRTLHTIWCNTSNYKPSQCYLRSYFSCWWLRIPALKNNWYLYQYHIYLNIFFPHSKSASCMPPKWFVAVCFPFQNQENINGSTNQVTVNRTSWRTAPSSMGYRIDLLPPGWQVGIWLGSVGSLPYGSKDPLLGMHGKGTIFGG